MKRVETVSGLIFFILGMILCIGSFKLNLGYFRKPGPGFMPFLSGAFLGLLGLILMFSSILKRLSEEEELNRKKIWVKDNWKRILFYLSALFGYGLVLNLLGFLITTFVFLFFLFKLTEPKKYMMPLVLSVGSVIVSYLIFWVWLRSPLPRGIFGF